MTGSRKTKKGGFGVVEFCQTGKGIVLYYTLHVFLVRNRMSEGARVLDCALGFGNNAGDLRFGGIRAH